MQTHTHIMRRASNVKGKTAAHQKVETKSLKPGGDQTELAAHRQTASSTADRTPGATVRTFHKRRSWKVGRVTSRKGQWA